MGKRPGTVFSPLLISMSHLHFWTPKVEGHVILNKSVRSFQVPGATGNFVFIKDAVYKKPDIALLPFPIYFAPEDEDPLQLEPIVADFGDIDPFMAAD